MKRTLNNDGWWLRTQRDWTRVFLSLVSIFGLLYVYYFLAVGIDHDEVEHAHVAFRMLNGDTPYRDFFQNHWPAYWLLLMPVLKAFPFSVDSLLMARGFNLLFLVAGWWIGLRWLKSFRGGRSWLGIGLYTAGLITLAYEMNLHMVRPDPFMTVLTLAALGLVPVRGDMGTGRALLSGLLMGVAASVSPKMVPIGLVVPGIVMVSALQTRQWRPLITLFPYAIGGILGLLPTFAWLLHNDLFQAFWFDVFDLNRAITKPWYEAFDLFEIMIYPFGLLGVLALYWRHLKKGAAASNYPILLLLFIVLGFPLAFMLRHPSFYNYQVLMVPTAVGFAALSMTLGLRMRRADFRMLLFAALLAYPVSFMVKPMLGLAFLGMNVGSDHLIPVREVQALMDLARPGDRTCTAFSPSHPVFCRDVGAVSNTWDAIFPEKVNDERQRERFQENWRDEITETLDQRPDIILRRHPPELWERAVGQGLISADELAALDRLLQAEYRMIDTGRQQVWIRKDTYPGLPEGINP